MKIELLESLPVDKEKRKKVKDAVQELVNCQLRMDAEKDLMKSILDVQKQDHQMKPSYIKKLAKLKFDSDYGKGEVAINFKHASQIVDDVDDLFNKGSNTHA